MKRAERPSAVLVVAIVEFCFGALALLGGVCGIGGQLIGKLFTPPAGAQAGPNVEAILRAKMPYYDAMQYGGLALNLVTGTVLIVSGLGLLKLRPWARWMTIGYACWYILTSIVGFIFSLTVNLPMMHEVIAEVRADPKMPPQAAHILDLTESMATTMVYVSLAFLAVPIALLVVMFLPHVKAAFRPAPPGSTDGEEFDDEGFDEEVGAPGDEAGSQRDEGIQPGEEPGNR